MVKVMAMARIRETGQLEETAVAGERVGAFVPAPLPPVEPALLIEGELAAQLRRAEAALSELEVAGLLVPSMDWFIYAFVRKEAVLSSQIEGTQATLIDLLAAQLDGDQAPVDADVEEVCNYIEALGYARGQLASAAGLPLSIRLLKQTHAVLMRGVRGAQKQPGEVRSSQNWIGGTRPGNAAFVPPPPHRLAQVLGQLEQYLHADDTLAPLVRVGLVHVQFETIHPFLDGNGRLGRLLITLALEHWGALTRPLLYLSLFFKRHRALYYERLNAVRTHGDWEGWLLFFLEGVEVIAREASHTAQALFALVSADRQRLLHAPDATLVGLRLFEQLPHHPIITASLAMRLLGTSRPTALKALATLTSAQLLTMKQGQGREQIYSYVAYLDLLREGTEL